ncbi:hypothetical protein [Maricaulis sp.]|uniref:hypothetical protein n=1 Tax=Maricaulis sp. TaxID=1486257 RepID=UPI002B267D68|nr:hypothetical protein [Maricaulis sp.]
MRVRNLITLMVAAIWLALPSGVAIPQADDVPSSASISVRLAGTRLYFEGEPSFFNYSVRVTGPNGYVGEVFSARRAPSFRLSDHGAVDDGVYRYEVTAATGDVVQHSSPHSRRANGREASAQVPRIGIASDGSFRVVNGQIFASSEAESET